MAKDISKRKQEQIYLYQTNEWKILDPTLKLLELTNEFSKVSGDKFFFFFFFSFFGHPMTYGVPGPWIRSKLQVRQDWTPNSLLWARDQTHVSVPPRCHWSHCAIEGTPTQNKYTKISCVSIQQQQNIREIKKAIPFIASKNRNKFNQGGEDLYKENYKTLMKEILFIYLFIYFAWSD